MEVGNCPLSVVCCEQCMCVSGLISHVDVVVLNPPIPVLGRWGAPVKRQWGGARCTWFFNIDLGSSSGCLGGKKRMWITECVNVALHLQLVWETILYYFNSASRLSCHCIALWIIHLANILKISHKILPLSLVHITIVALGPSATSKFK